MTGRLRASVASESPGYFRIKFSRVWRLIGETIPQAQLIFPPLWAREVSRRLTIDLVSPPGANIRPILLALRVTCSRAVAMTVLPLGHCVPQVSRCNGHSRGHMPRFYALDYGERASRVACFEVYDASGHGDRLSGQDVYLRSVLRECCANVRGGPATARATRHYSNASPD